MRQMEMDEEKLEICKKAYQLALGDDSEGIIELFKNNPTETLFITLTPGQDTVFHIAAYRGSLNLLQVLLNMVPREKNIGEFLKMTKNTSGHTVLHELAVAGNVEAAELLIGAAAAARKELVGVQNNLGETPLYVAAASGQTKMVEYLATEVEDQGLGLSGHFRRNDDVSVLQAAVLGQHFETAIWLVRKDGESADCTDKSGKTCLHLLASMPAAFRSTSRMVFHGPVLDLGSYKNIRESIRLYGLAGIQTDEMENIPEKIIVSNQSKDLEHGEAGTKTVIPRSNKAQGSKIGHACCRGPVQGWKTMSIIHDEKKGHELAVKLAKMLVKRDKSWLVSKQRDWSNTVCLEREKSEPNISTTAVPRSKKSPETPLLIAASNGISEIFEEIISVYPQAIEHVNEEGQNVLHMAVMHRQYGIFNRLKKMEVTWRRLAAEIDKHGCTILHYAALTKYYAGGTKPTAALQLQEEWKWFKEVKSIVPTTYLVHRNKDNCTAEELFKRKHKDQHDEAKKWVKDTSQSCSAVSVLIATVVFSAAFTVPGGSNDQGPDKGLPVLLQRPLYKFFTVMDVAAVASSLTSVVIFLSVLTSSLELTEFEWKVPRRMSLGFIFLFSSVTATMMAFTATIVLTVQLEKRWTTSLTYAAAFLPIGVFVLFQFRLYFEFCVALLRSIRAFFRKLA